MLNHILLGTLQGIFEWIPISSEGIVALSSKFLIKDVDFLDIAIFLHLGTLFAVLIYFRKDWKEVLTLKNKTLLRFLIIATITSLAIGFFVYTAINRVVIGTGLLFIMGIGLLFTSFFQKKGKILNLNLDYIALISGVLQGFSVIPGLSRSGSTIFGLSLGKINPSEILKYSYMMSAPVILASSSYLMLKNPVLISQGWISLIFSFLVGLVSLHFLMKISQRINFSKFALIFGILCLFGAAIGFIL